MLRVCLTLVWSVMLQQTHAQLSMKNVQVSNWRDDSDAKKSDIKEESLVESLQQRDLEEQDHRVHDVVLRDSDSADERLPLTNSDHERPEYTTEEAKGINYQHDEVLDANFDRQRRLEEHDNQPIDDDEEEDKEALPVIPGLTDVELAAFNPMFANEEILDKIIDWSYDQVASVSRFRDNYIHVEDLYSFLLKTLNPLDEEIDDDDKTILTDAVTELRKQQGLVDEEQVVYRGFIARGMPLRFLQSLAHEMHQTVQTRRLQAIDEL